MKPQHCASKLLIKCILSQEKIYLLAILFALMSLGGRMVVRFLSMLPISECICSGVNEFCDWTKPCKQYTTIVLEITSPSASHTHALQLIVLSFWRMLLLENGRCNFLSPNLFRLIKYVSEQLIASNGYQWNYFIKKEYEWTS